MWQIMIDVSGMPPEDIYIGLILFNDNYKKRFLYEFYEKFPDLIRYTKKSTSIDKEYLYKILEFFNDKRLKMVCYHFKDNRWKQHERKLNELIKEKRINHKYRTNFKNFYERLMGILYYYAITQIGNKWEKYNVVICHESGLDIWTILTTIQKLAKRDKWEINPHVNIRKVEHLLKMADYVAGANRKNEKFKIDLIEKHTILRDPIQDSDLKEIFKI